MRARGCEQRDDRLRSIPFRSVGCHGRPGSRPASPWHSQTGNPTGANRILTTEHMAPVVAEFAKASQSSLPLETQRESAAMDTTGETPDLVRTICRSSSVRAVRINFKRRCPAVNKSGYSKYRYRSGFSISPGAFITAAIDAPSRAPHAPAYRLVGY